MKEENNNLKNIEDSNAGCTNKAEQESGANNKKEKSHVLRVIKIVLLSIWLPLMLIFLLCIIKSEYSLASGEIYGFASISTCIILFCLDEFFVWLFELIFVYPFKCLKKKSKKGKKDNDLSK